MFMLYFRILPRKPHNHEPDLDLLKSLQRRAEALEAAESTNVKLSDAFKSALRGKEGACLISYPTIARQVGALIQCQSLFLLDIW